MQKDMRDAASNQLLKGLKMHLGVLADDPGAGDLFQGNLLLGPALDAARVGVVEIACCPGRKAQERRPALGFLAITDHHRMRDQDGHGGGLLPSGPRALLKRLAQFWLTGLLGKRDQAIADLARHGHALWATGSDIDWHRRARPLLQAGAPPPPPPGSSLTASPAPTPRNTRPG